MKQFKKNLCLVGALNFSLLAFAAPTEVKVGILISQTGGMADIGAAGQNGLICLCRYAQYSRISSYCC